MAEAAYGFSFEKLVLYAWSLGIGTVWIGGTMNRDAFEKASQLKRNEMMPCVTPAGYPAEKKSVRETMMRKGIKADDRKPWEKLFFKNDFQTPLSPGKLDGQMKKIFEMVRWSPSAVNKQPWRIVQKDGIYHFYEKKDKGYVGEATGDLQKIDVGISLCHFVLGAESMGMKYGISVGDPGIEVMADTEYMVSVKLA